MSRPVQQLIHCYHSDDGERPFTDHLLAWRRHPSTFAHRSPPRHLTDRLRQLFWKPLRASSSTALQSRLASALSFTHCHTYQSPASTARLFFLPLPAFIFLPKTATAELVTDQIPLPQLHITLCIIHCRAPTALQRPQHSSCILPINTRFGFTPIGWVE